MRLLAYTSPARGHLYPVVPLLTELSARGHEVSAITLASEVDRVRALGIDAAPLGRELEACEMLDWRERTPPRALLAVLRTFAARAAHEAPELSRAIAERDPDAILVDVNSWGAAAVAESSGRPWAMFCPYLPPLPSRDAPPFGPGLRPRGGPLGRVRDAAVRRGGTAIFRRAAAAPLNAVRAAQGVGPARRLEELLARPPLLIVMTAEGFEYPRGDWPENVRLVGALNWAPPQPPPAWLAELPDPLVLVTCSTERQRDSRLIRVALEALPGAGFSVLATSAAHDPGRFEPPPRARVVRFANHEAVLVRAACVVCHGGMGITQKALSAGVPAVVVPYGRDQLETARRVEFAGAGVSLSPRRLTPERLLDAVRRATARREGAQRVSRAFVAAGGAPAAADALEALAARTPMPAH